MYLIPDKLNNLHLFTRLDTGLLGIKNLENTCYINSILQCLLNLYNLSDFLLEKNITKNNSKEKLLTEEFIKLNKKYWEPKNNKEPIVPNSFLNELFKNKLFTFGEQSDASEFLSYMLNCIHEYTSHEVSFNIQSKNPETAIAKMRISSLKSWKKYFNKYSFVIDFIYGQYKCSLTCLTCKKETVSFEPFCIIDLPLPDVNVNVSIYDCFNKNSNAEILESGRRCTKCKKNTQTRKNITIWKPPRILIICLKRFDKNLNKINTNILFPKEKLTILSKFSNKEFNYYLSSIIYHRGSYYGGHYYCICRTMMANGPKWILYDDDVIHNIKDNQITSANSYILIYKSH
jgi:ubiquitin C-terminal hydrolase